MTEEAQPGPRIIEAFQGYTPPFDAGRLIRRMLRDVPPQFLRGLHAIVLTNVASLSRHEREQRTRGRGSRFTLGKALGYYSQAWKGEPARITILLDNFEKQWGRSWLRVRFIRDLVLSGTLFHELGHHIHQIHQPEYEGPENVADKWSEKFSSRFMRRRYWYLVPLFVPVALALKLGKYVGRLYRKSRAKRAK